MGASGIWNKSAVGKMLRLVHALHEQRGAGAARQRAMLEGVCGLVDGSVGFLIVGRVGADGAWDGASARHVHGMDGRAGRLLADSLDAGGDRGDPAFRVLLGKAVRRGEGATCTATRRELLGDGAWYASAHVKEVRKRAGVDDGLYSAQLLGAGVMACLCLARAGWEGRPFSRGECERVDVLHGACAWVYREEVPPAEVEALPLSPREKQTLWKLLSGSGEKQIAAQMRLSRNTVHHYVKSLYKHFRVSSRAELLARWVEREG